MRTFSPATHRSRQALVAILLLLVACLVLALLPTGADAAAVNPPTAGRTWGRGANIKVYSQLPAAQSKAVDFVIAHYNASGANVKLTRVMSARGANLILKRDDMLFVPGIATQGKPSRGPAVATFNLRRPQANEPYQWTFLYAHEIGHVLGIDHPRTNGCTVMNPSFFQKCPVNKTFGNFTCRILQQQDKGVLVRLYGGRASAQGPVECSNATGKPVQPAPAVPGFSAVTSAVPDRATDFPWLTVAWVSAPGYRIRVWRTTGTCPAAANADQWEIAPPDVEAPFDAGSFTSVQQRDVPFNTTTNAYEPAGPYCVQAQLTRPLDGGVGPITSAQVTWTPPALGPGDPPAA